MSTDRLTTMTAEQLWSANYFGDGDDAMLAMDAWCVCMMVRPDERLTVGQLDRAAAVLAEVAG